MTLKKKHPPGAIKEIVEWDNLEGDCQLYYVAVGQEVTKERKDCLSPHHWNVGPRYCIYHDDFVFQNYWMAYAYYRKIEGNK